MTRKELCEMCTDYSTDTKCENKESCKLQAILTENAQLKMVMRIVSAEVFCLTNCRSGNLQTKKEGMTLLQI